MRRSVRSLHAGPPNFVLSGAPPDDLLINEWVLVMRGDGKSPQTIVGYTNSIRQLVSFLRQGNFPTLTAATAEQLREWLTSPRERGNKPATVHTRYRGVYAFYGWLKREGEISENPLERIEPPRVPETVQPFYSGDELRAALKALHSRRTRGVDAARTRAIVLVLFDTGLRASELCNLRTDGVNWESQTIGGSSLRSAASGTECIPCPIDAVRSLQAEYRHSYAPMAARIDS